LFRQSIDGTRGENVTEPQPERLAERFEIERPHLRAVAYRMLGSLSEADDVVQDAWLRLSRSDTSEVENLRGWLTTVVARLCLDALRSRKARREDPVGFQIPEPILSSTGGMDPEQEALLAESVGLAMLIVLETLTPAERLAFVLHDVFAVPFNEIAPILDRTPTATRQLASRARRRVQGSAVESDVDLSGQRKVVDAFVAASRAGDFDALLQILDPDVLVRADFGKLRDGTSEVRGRTAVAQNALAFRRLASGARPAIVNGGAGVVVFAGGRPYAIIGVTVRQGRIVEIDILADPDRLSRVDTTVLDA
jgi:RNA polymerase sigma-70 factor (ECF subfamily)